MNNIKNFVLTGILALVLIISGLSCSGGSLTSASSSENRTYTMDDVIAIAQKFSPDCRRFFRTSENETGSG